jgi:hypothetical protein
LVALPDEKVYTNAQEVVDKGNYVDHGLRTRVN